MTANLPVVDLLKRLHGLWPRSRSSSRYQEPATWTT
jgi:hypothetical protein